MILQLVRARRRQVLIDINTQRDILLANGQSCIRNHRRVLSHIRRMMAWARGNEIPVISTCDVHANGHGNGDGHGDSHILVHSGDGQEKVSYTLMHNRISFTADNSTDLPRDVLRNYRQVVFQKRTMDPFDEPRIDRLLTEVRANEFVIVGATVEGAVQATVLGLLQRHKKVTVIVDAVGSRDMHEAKMALRKMEAKGATMLETKRLAGSSRLHQVGACRCDSCQRLLVRNNGQSETQGDNSQAN